MEDKQFIYNHQNEKVLSTLVEQLNTCDEFIFSVAFITSSGVSQLLPTLKYLESKNVPGKILGSTYLNFTDPTALQKLNSFTNIKVKLISDNAFHAKGYFFKKVEKWTSIIGSSNLTQSALTSNEEWNILTIHDKQSSVINQILTHFDSLWHGVCSLEEKLITYIPAYKLQKKQGNYVQVAKNTEIIANKMQVKTLENLKQIMNGKNDKALVVSATGSGKTILSALAVKEAKPRKMIFIVHRENIARKALETFKRVIDNDEITYGLYTGNVKESEADYLFATIQSVSNNLDYFKELEYDYIIIDEVHHGGAKTYQNVFQTIKSKFWLGLTATPDRSDNFNIFEMFDYNLAYEYRLKEALNDEILCPFHYFGVSDLTIDGQLVTDKSTINDLTSEIRIKHIVETIELYTTVEEIKGLIFVSNINEAFQLSELLNLEGFNTITLSSRDSEAVRNDAISDLEQDKLQYIITVDVFNEGIDIPCVNQVLLLRPTKSAIVYIQQIGRGLRKDRNKKYVTIIDFIGNYKQNYLIPVALSNNNTYNKDQLKQDVLINGINCLTGASTIQFEQILKEQLIKQITTTNLSTLANIKRDFVFLQHKLNRIPKLVDFTNNEVINPELIIQNDLYPKIKAKILKVNHDFNEEQLIYLEYVSKQVYPAGRLHEIFILNTLMENDELEIDKTIKSFELKYQLQDESKQIKNAFAHLSREIFKSISDEYKFKPFINRKNDKYIIDHEFKLLLTENLKAEIQDVLAVAESEYVNKAYDMHKLLAIGQTYSRKQAYKYLLKDFNNGYQVGGYTVFNDIAIMFINLDETKGFAHYDNELLSNQEITWFSKANRKLFKSDGSLSSEGLLAKNYVNIKLFVKRHSSEKFFYLGDAYTSETVIEPNRIKYFFKLQQAIPNDIYKYLNYKSEE